jgi:hypothetical protein
MQNGEEDFVAWAWEKSGIFTVKSAYQLALSMEYAGRMGSSGSLSQDDGRPMYKELWRVKVPPKVRIFGWNVASECLAT